MWLGSCHCVFSFLLLPIALPTPFCILSYYFLQAPHLFGLHEDKWNDQWWVILGGLITSWTLFYFSPPPIISMFLFFFLFTHPLLPCTGLGLSQVLHQCQPCPFSSPSVPRVKLREDSYQSLGCHRPWVREQGVGNLGSLFLVFLIQMVLCAGNLQRGGL